MQVFWQLNLVSDREQNLTYQSLSLFVKPKDPDGFEDIEELYIINDDQELSWQLDRETWAQSGAEEEIWIGSNSLKMPDGASFPAGEYRILLRDVGGDSAEQSFRLRPVSTKEATGYLPQVTVDDRSIRVTGDGGLYQLWVYDKSGGYTASFPIADQPLTIQTIVSAQPSLRQGFTFRVYGLVGERNLGVSSGPYYVEP
jgi:hypothetical protein